MSFAVTQTTYMLHDQPYREISVLADFSTPLGHLRAILRGARGKVDVLAWPFVPLEARWREYGELETVARLESVGIPGLLSGQVLFSGLYFNGLLIHLLPAKDPQSEIFAHYVATLSLLAAGRPIEPLLRAFEWRLLGQLGYGFALDVDIGGRPIEPQALCQLLPEAGLEPVAQLQPGLLQGSELLSTANADWSTPDALAAVKCLMHQALVPHLGGRPLISRELFMNRKELLRN